MTALTILIFFWLIEENYLLFGFNSLDGSLVSLESFFLIKKVIVPINPYLM